MNLQPSVPPSVSRTTPPGTGHAIEADRVSLRVPASDLPIVQDVTLTVNEGEFVALVGPSGCGKTTFLNMIAGLQSFSGGTLTVRGEPPRKGRLDTAYALARDALLPWRDAMGNVELALQLRGIPKEERRDRAMMALRRVGLEDSARQHRSQLSQGMRQRVALARTFVTEPTLLILDEPFAALDAQTRIFMQELLLALLEEFLGTMLFVTHDLAEAITLADRVIVFTKRPARVLATYDVELPRPRRVAELRADPRFSDLFEKLWADIVAETRK